MIGTGVEEKMLYLLVKYLHGLDVSFLAMLDASPEGIKVENLAPLGQHGNQDPVVPGYKRARYGIRTTSKTKHFIS
jgi:hypothetical protein